ncbi:hypothetical protein APHAL10511_006434 [Amanita phalloides]|nr:hypothetical protein APHAL10511_006434 [Amanita phalloides]
MAKCGAKPKQISARQLRNLVREEKRALAAQRSARQPPPAPPPPRLKKRICTRPSRHDVSLARKKQVKVKPRSMVRRARTESSVAFSAITEEIPLFNILKRVSNLVYMPQAPVSLVCPITPPRGTPAIDILPSTSNASPGLDLGGRTELLETPRVVATNQPRLEGNAEFKSHASPNASFSPTSGRTSPDLQRTPTQDNPASFVSSRYEDSAQVQVLSQLPMGQESHLVVPPKVLLPKEPLSVDKCLERNIEQVDSPETIYYRSLMTSIWAQPTESSFKQSDLRDILHVHHPNSDIFSSTVQESVKLAEQPTQRNRLVRNTQTTISCLSTVQATIDVPRPETTTRNPRSTELEVTLKLDDTEVAPNRGARRSSRTYYTPGAFANTVLRQTGHLRKKDVTPQPIAGNCCKSPASNSDSKAQSVSGSLRMHEKPIFNSLRFQSTTSESLQSRAPTSIPYRSSLDGPKLPSLAPAAIIKNDPFRRPSERPSRKRVISVGRVIDYAATTPCEVQDTRAEALSIHDVRQTTPKHENYRPRSKRHWTKRVIVDDICHHVSMEGGGSEVEMPLNVFPTPETGNSFKQRITRTLRAMYDRLWA